MLTQIEKRDGRLVTFDAAMISKAISKAFEATNSKRDTAYCMALANQVVEELDKKQIIKPNVEQVQDIVEEVLNKNGHFRCAKAYILYRADRTKIRETKTPLMRVFDEIHTKDAKDSDLMRDNANVNADTAMGIMLKFGSESTQDYFKKVVLKPEHTKAHEDGDIHIHDLDFLGMTTTCCQIDLIKLFTGGFSTGHGVLREPNDITSYSALACIAIQSNQNDQHGGQSVVNFDYGLAAGVRKTFIRLYRQNLQKAVEYKTEVIISDEEAKAFQNKLFDKGYVLRLDENKKYQEAEAEILESYYGIAKDAVKRCQKAALEKSVKETDRTTFQAMEALIHNLNTMHSRAGAQTPFSSINYGMDTSAEGRMIIKNVLLAHEAGLGTGETPIFPIHIFRVKEGVSYNPEDPNYDLFRLAIRVSSKRLFPNFAFLDAPFNKQYYVPGRPETEIAYMGCRTRVMGNIYDPTRETAPSRGNLSFTSINLPRIAIRSKGDIQWFFEELDRKLDLCIEQLLERFEIQCRKRVKNYPFLMGEGVWIDSEKLSREDEVREVLKHGTLSVGFIGLAETLVSLIGEHHGQSEKAQNLGLDIVRHMREHLDDVAKKLRLNVTLLATPAEGLSGRFVRLDKKVFGEIPGITDRDYYTNSFHIPVYYNIRALDKIKLEAPYHALTNAGHITYVELDGDTAENLEVYEKLIRAMHDAGVGYGSINHPVDRDTVCGYTGIIGDDCPHCGRKGPTEEEPRNLPFERIRRITGYLVGTLDRFNDAKAAEERDRVKHNVL
ncbi:MAG: anaerobic ribonucleoside triphosphate reductase [Oscillospiraceae bacterium]|nr:anaerobic ribonucleoside triphosphate reductase [Oscillospiraceae bacterium]